MRLSTSTSQTIHTALFALLLVLSASMAGPVNARDSQSTRSAVPPGTITAADAFETLAVISNDELAELRGGFELSGLQIDIGAYIRTFIDGMQVLESMVNLTGSDVTAGGQPSVSTVLNAVELLPGLQIVDSSTGGLSELRDQIPDQVDLGALNDANGVILNDSKGFTAALHQINRSQIISAIVNTANGRQLRQEVDVTVDIANFKQFQRAARSALKANALSRAGRLR